MALTISSLKVGSALQQLADQLDTNGNGRVTRAEIRSCRAKLEAGDLLLTPAELRSLTEIEKRVFGRTGDRAPKPRRGRPAVEVITGDRSIDPSGNLNRLSKVQQAVVADVQSKARTRSDAARAALLRRAERCGYSKADIDLTLAYIRDQAPICLNFHPDRDLEIDTLRGRFAVSVNRETGRLIDALLADGCYKSQFETGISGFSPSAYPGGGRDRWEKTLFEGGYHTPGSKPSDRPKYGTLDAAKVRGGPAPHYGSCYFVLKPGAKVPATFTPRDSSDCRAKEVGTAENFQHILLRMRESHFERIVDMALGKSARPQNYKWGYVESQIHGPIDFAKDIDHIVVHRKFEGTPYEGKLKELAKKGGFKIRWTRGRA